MFPKLWNEIEIDLKETKSAKIFKQRVINIYLKNYERFKCEKPSCILREFLYKNTIISETLLAYFCLCIYHH